MNEYIENLEAALIDLLDGSFENDIQKFSGCTSERSKEMYRFYLEVLKNYSKKHNL